VRRKQEKKKPADSTVPSASRHKRGARRVDAHGKRGKSSVRLSHRENVHDAVKRGKEKTTWRFGCEPSSRTSVPGLGKKKKRPLAHVGREKRGGLQPFNDGEEKEREKPRSPTPLQGRRRSVSKTKERGEGERKDGRTCLVDE